MGNVYTNVSTPYTAVPSATRTQAAPVPPTPQAPNYTQPAGTPTDYMSPNNIIAARNLKQSVDQLLYQLLKLPDKEITSEQRVQLQRLQAGASVPNTGLTQPQESQLLQELALTPSHSNIANITNLTRQSGIGSALAQISQLSTILPADKLAALLIPSDTQQLMLGINSMLAKAFAQTRNVVGSMLPEAWENYTQERQTLTKQAQQSGNKAVGIASRYLGMNGIKDKDKLKAFTRRFDDNLWCADFTTAVMREAGTCPWLDKSGNPIDQVNTGLVRSIMAWAKNHHCYKTKQQGAQVGDAVIFGGGSHIGIVVAVNPDGSIDTIEGNSGNAAGGTVKRNHYSKDNSYVTGFVAHK